MSFFLDFRANNVGGPVVGPRLYEGDGTAQKLELNLIADERVPGVVAGRDILFATHGFNVSRPHGACSLGLLDSYLKLDSPGLFIGMLWPGDSWLPIVDYPFEGSVTIDCGTRLADYCNQFFEGARSLSFVSHSLGARLVLEGVKHLARRAQSVCLTAGAINRDCLLTEYNVAANNCDRVSVLASHRDDVLKVAFSIGDPLADLLHDDHTPFQPAIGYDGPPQSHPQPVSRPWQIPDGSGYGHGDYLPPNSTIPLPPNPQARWSSVADFMRHAFLGLPQSWPPI